MWARTTSRVRELLALGVTAVSLAGCGGADPNNYRSAAKLNATTPEATSQQQTTMTLPNDGNATPVDVVTGSQEVIEEVPVSALGPVNVVDGASVAMLLKAGSDANPLPTNVAVQPASASTTQTTADNKPRTPELLIPEKSFQRDVSSKAWRVSYDDLDLLKVLNLEPVTDNAVELMPSWLKDLNGQKIRIRGFMYPTFEAEGIERFVLARDNQICCFGRDPKLYDLVQVDMRSGKTTNYIPATRAFDVIGRFKIDMASENGKPYGLYYIEDAEIIDR